jgi:hypothetical protein
MLGFRARSFVGPGRTWTSSPKFLHTPLILLGTSLPCTGPRRDFCRRRRRLNDWWSAPQCRRVATAKNSNSSKVYRREGYLATVKIEPVIFTLLRCTSSELFFFCSTSNPDRAAGGPRRMFILQAHATQQRPNSSDGDHMCFKVEFFSLLWCL